MRNPAHHLHALGGVPDRVRRRDDHVDQVAQLQAVECRQRPARRIDQADQVRCSRGQGAVGEDRHDLAAQLDAQLPAQPAGLVHDNAGRVCRDRSVAGPAEVLRLDDAAPGQAPAAGDRAEPGDEQVRVGAFQQRRPTFAIRDKVPGSAAWRSRPALVGYAASAAQPPSVSTLDRSRRSARRPSGASTSTLSPVRPDATSGVGDTPARCIAVWWIKAKIRPMPSASINGTPSCAAATTGTRALTVAAASGYTAPNRTPCNRSICRIAELELVTGRRQIGQRRPGPEHTHRHTGRIRIHRLHRRSGTGPLRSSSPVSQDVSEERLASPTADE